MTRIRAALVIAALCVTATVTAQQQQQQPPPQQPQQQPQQLQQQPQQAPQPSQPQQQPVPEKNPLEGREAAILAGMGIFRSRCADCHGIDAGGVRGPDLRQVWASGRTDSGLFHTVRNGVPGTEMPAAGIRTNDDEIWKVLAYLRTIAAQAPTEVQAGNVENGERVFRTQCASCHRVNGRGGRLGPDLSRIGIARSRAVVVRRVRGAVEDSVSGYEPVTVTTKNGQAVQGVKKNEDLFSVQVMDARERIQGYLKSDVREVVDGKKSAMPVFGPDRLSENDLTDLLGYLATLKGFDPSVDQ
jgi:putative heme-binding domain-containing protein